jgi:hypothetical protein
MELKQHISQCFGYFAGCIQPLAGSSASLEGFGTFDSTKLQRSIVVGPQDTVEPTAFFQRIVTTTGEFVVTVLAQRMRSASYVASLNIMSEKTLSSSLDVQ